MSAIDFHVIKASKLVALPGPQHALEALHSQVILQEQLES